MLKQLLEKIEKGRALLAKVRAQAGADHDFSKGTEFNGTDEEKCASVRKLNDDLIAWAKQQAIKLFPKAVKRNLTEVRDFSDPI